jgi:hypothetical protein
MEESKDRKILLIDEKQKNYKTDTPLTCTVLEKLLSFNFEDNTKCEMRTNCGLVVKKFMFSIQYVNRENAKRVVSKGKII